MSVPLLVLGGFSPADVRLALWICAAVLVLRSTQLALLKKRRVAYLRSLDAEGLEIETHAGKETVVPWARVERFVIEPLLLQLLRIDCQDSGVLTLYGSTIRSRRLAALALLQRNAVENEPGENAHKGPAPRFVRTWDFAVFVVLLPPCFASFMMVCAVDILRLSLGPEALMGIAIYGAAHTVACVIGWFAARPPRLTMDL
jgi:hypothetical protein